MDKGSGEQLQNAFLVVLAQYRASVETQRAKLVDAYTHLLGRIDASVESLGVGSPTSLAASNPHARCSDGAKPRPMCLLSHLQCLLQDAKKMSRLLSQNIPVHFDACAAHVASFALDALQGSEDGASLFKLEGGSYGRTWSLCSSLAHSILSTTSHATPSLSRVAGHETSPPMTTSLPPTLHANPGKKTGKQFRFAVFAQPSTEALGTTLASLAPYVGICSPWLRDGNIEGGEWDPVEMAALAVSRLRTGVRIVPSQALLDLYAIALLVTTSGCASPKHEQVDLGGVMIDAADSFLRHIKESSDPADGMRLVMVLPLTAGCMMYRTVAQFYNDCSAAQRGDTPNVFRNVVAGVPGASTYLQSVLLRIVRQTLFVPADSLARQLRTDHTRCEPHQQTSLADDRPPCVRRPPTTSAPCVPIPSIKNAEGVTTTERLESQQLFSSSSTANEDDTLLLEILREIEATSDRSDAQCRLHAPVEFRPAAFAADDAGGNHSETRKRQRCSSVDPQEQTDLPAALVGATAPHFTTLRRNRSRSLAECSTTDIAGGGRATNVEESQDVQFDPSSGADSGADDDHLGPIDASDRSRGDSAGAHAETSPRGLAEDNNNSPSSVSLHYVRNSASAEYVEDAAVLTFQMTNSIRSRRRELQQALAQADLAPSGGAVPPIAPRGRLGAAAHYLAATHILIVADGVIERTEKYLSFCASGKPIVSPRYITDSVARGCWLPLDTSNRRRALEYELSPARRRLLTCSVQPQPISVDDTTGDSARDDHPVPSVLIPCCDGVCRQFRVVLPFTSWRVLLFASSHVGRGVQSILTAGGCRVVVADPNPPDAAHWKPREPPTMATLPCGAAPNFFDNAIGSSSGTPLAPSALNAGCIGNVDGTRCVPAWLADFLQRTSSDDDGAAGVGNDNHTHDGCGDRSRSSPDGSQAQVNAGPCGGSANASTADAPMFLDIAAIDILRCLRSDAITHVLVEGPLSGDVFVAPQCLPNLFVDDPAFAVVHRKVFSLELLHHVLCCATTDEYNWDCGALTEEGERALPPACRIGVP